mgnify:CR=1 FL=1
MRIQSSWLLPLLLIGLFFLLGVRIIYAQQTSATVSENEVNTQKTVYFSLTNHALFIGKLAKDDVYLGGNRVDVNSIVKGDLFAVGRTIVVNGLYDQDVRIVGDTVTLNSSVSGNALLIARRVKIGPEAVLQGQTTIVAHTVEVEGKILGKLDIRAFTVISDASASVRFSKLTYKDSLQTILRPSVLPKSITTIFLVTNILSTLIVGFILLRLISKKIRPIFLVIKENWFSTFLSGLVILVLSGCGLVFLAFTILGIPLASLVISGLFICYAITKALASIIIGEKVLKLFSNKNGNFPALLTGAVLLEAVWLYPLAGLIFHTAISSLGIGYVWLTFRKDCPCQSNPVRL